LGGNPCPARVEEVLLKRGPPLELLQAFFFKQTSRRLDHPREGKAYQTKGIQKQQKRRKRRREERRECAREREREKKKEERRGEGRRRGKSEGKRETAP